MFISVRHAQEIVMEIGNVVGQNINLMDEHGVIIASTDPNRIGSHHSAANEILTRGLEELYVSPEEADATTRPGLNLAVKDGDSTVGVVGISGDYGSVYGYGRIVKKMTEILIRERTEEDSRRADRRILHRFLEEWVLEDGFRRGGQDFAERGQALGIDIRLPRRVLVVSPAIETHTLAPEAEQRLSAELESLLTMRRQALTFRSAGRQIVLLQTRREAELLTFAREIQHSVRQAYDLPLIVGCDGDAPDVHTAYRQAERAWQAARLLPERLALYRQLALELFADEVSAHTKREYLRKVFPDQDEAQLTDWMLLLDAYFAADGSLQKAAVQLYIHKNTLQYRLLKLRELSGYDLRHPGDAAVFYLARAFYSQLREISLL